MRLFIIASKDFLQLRLYDGSLRFEWLRSGQNDVATDVCLGTLLFRTVQATGTVRIGEARLQLKRASLGIRLIDRVFHPGQGFNGWPNKRIQKLQSLYDRTVRFASRFAKPYKMLAGKDLSRTLEPVRRVYGLMKGIPTEQQVIHSGLLLPP